MIEVCMLLLDYIITLCLTDGCNCQDRCKMYILSPVRNRQYLIQYTGVLINP